MQRNRAAGRRASAALPPPHPKRHTALNHADAPFAQAEPFAASICGSITRIAFHFPVRNRK